MKCEKCKKDMIQKKKGNVQGWICPVCGWNILTTYLDDIYIDNTEYSIFIKDANGINNDKIKFIAKLCGVNYIIAKKLLMTKNVYVFKAKAPIVKGVINELYNLGVKFEVKPPFIY